MRLDQLLVERGLALTRAKAQALVLAGEVVSGTARLDKPGLQVRPDIELGLKTTGPRWVSRGAEKLLAGLEAFGLDPAGLTAIDVGASTGGFTDVLLARGAARVYAVDVGYGQLDHRLRTDARVIVLERTNARYLTRAQVPDPVDLVVCDASFIPLHLVLPAALALAGPDARVVALVKPQFEAGREEASRGQGVIRDAAVHARVCADAVTWIEGLGWNVLGVVPSPLLGPKGNREFLLGAGRRSGAAVPSNLFTPAALGGQRQPTGREIPMKRHATAVWHGALSDGNGAITVQSGVLSDQPYSFNSRFKDESGKSGTNPEELIAAAHAGCFAMQLSHMLAEAGHPAETLDAKAVVSVEQEGGGFAIKTSEITLKAKVPGIDQAAFDDLAAKAKAGCPVSKALAGIQITLNASLDNA